MLKQLIKILTLIEEEHGNIDIFTVAEDGGYKLIAMSEVKVLANNEKCVVLYDNEYILSRIDECLESKEVHNYTH